LLLLFIYTCLILFVRSYLL